MIVVPGSDSMYDSITKIMNRFHFYLCHVAGLSADVKETFALLPSCRVQSRAPHRAAPPISSCQEECIVALLAKPAIDLWCGDQTTPPSQRASAHVAILRKVDLHEDMFQVKELSDSRFRCICNRHVFDL